MTIEKRIEEFGEPRLSIAKEAVWEFHELHRQWPTLKQAAAYLAFYSAEINGDVEEARRQLLASVRNGDVITGRKEEA